MTVNLNNLPKVCIPNNGKRLQKSFYVKLSAISEIFAHPKFRDLKGKNSKNQSHQNFRLKKTNISHRIGIGRSSGNQNHCPFTHMKVAHYRIMLIKRYMNHTFKIDQIIKASIWLLFGTMALFSFFDFADWTDALRWVFRFGLIALLLHLAVSWIYRS